MIVHYPRGDREAAMGLTGFRDRMFCPAARVRESWVWNAAPSRRQQFGAL
jgi:hypothetical protein